MIIDSHHHFWKYTAAEYGWIDDEMKVIRRDFLPADLAAAISDAGVDGVVSVQARQTLEETTWLLSLAAEHSFIRGVVGWVPLVAERVDQDLDALTQSAGHKLKSVRHVIQGEPDADYILRDDFNRGIRMLRKFGLAYDILILERHLPQTIRFVDRHPDQTFIVDHIAKPRIREQVMSPWQENMAELAERPNVYCKLSGMVTEADYHQWTPAQLRPYADTVLDAFGPNRVMFGSDWPVCLIACGYARWRTLVGEFTATLSASEEARVLGETAIEAYAL